VTVPIDARIVLLKDGQQVSEAGSAKQLAFMPREPGTYRVEVFQDGLGKPFDSLPWIMSNPIYVR